MPFFAACLVVLDPFNVLTKAFPAGAVADDDLTRVMLHTRSVRSSHACLCGEIKRSKLQRSAMITIMKKL